MNTFVLIQEQLSPGGHKVSGALLGSASYYRVPGGHSQIQDLDAAPVPELLQPPGGVLLGFLHLDRGLIAVALGSFKEEDPYTS